MAINAFEGPVVVYGPSGITAPFGGYNPEQSPSLFDQGAGLLDPRGPFTYYPGQDFGAPMYGFISGCYVLVDQAPSALAANNIAASQTPGASALTLVVATGAGITVAQSITNAATGATVTGLLAIDLKQTPVTFGSSATTHVWDPTKSIARNVRITSGGNDTGITFLVVGYDLYGYPMSERITGANAGVASGAKAFKYIASITPSAGVATTASAGTGDVFGFPMRADRFQQVELVWNNAWITANTGFVAAVTTDPATVTTGDVRGTYNVQSASDGTKQLYMAVSPGVANLTTSKGLFGVTQV